jgi:hypothetical protein
VNGIKEAGKMKLWKNEINELIKIVENSNFYHGIGLGFSPNVCDEEIKHTWWKEEPHGKFSDETKKEIFSVLMFPFNETCVFIYPRGTHCGSLKFLFGWIHHDNKTEDDAEEAVMPQTNNPGIEILGRTIKDIRKSIQEEYAVSETRQPFVNGSVVSEGYIILQGDNIEFR